MKKNGTRCTVNDGVFCAIPHGLKAILSYKIKIKNQHALKKFSCSLQVFRENLLNFVVGILIAGNQELSKVYRGAPLSADLPDESRTCSML